MKKFDRLCEQLFKANIPFSQNDSIISIRPDNADRNIYMSVYAGASSYCWYKRTSKCDDMRYYRKFAKPISVHYELLCGL